MSMGTLPSRMPIIDHCRSLFAVVLGVCCWLVVCTEANAHEPTPVHTEADADAEHHPSTRNLIGARIGYLHAAVNRDGALVRIPGFLAGLSYERTLVPRWLEVEISVPVAVLLEEEHTVVAIPIDVHFKKPFHLTRRVTPYVGIGPALDVEVAPEVKVFYGGSLAVGGYVWFSDSVGLDVEADYNLVVKTDRTLGQELFLAAGPVVRF